jgi:hypothetical protein
MPEKTADRLEKTWNERDNIETGVTVPSRGASRRVAPSYRVPVKNIEVVPAALRGKLFEVDPDPVAWRRGLDEPSTLCVHRVVADGVRQPAPGRIEPKRDARQSGLDPL